MTKGKSAGPARLKSPILLVIDVSPKSNAMSVKKTPRKKFIFFMQLINFLF